MNSSHEPDMSHILAAVRTIMVRAHYAFLTTFQAGLIQTRLMDAFVPEEDMSVWMATNTHTRKLEAVRAGNRSTLAYTDGAGNGYVSLTGQLHAFQGRAAKEPYQRYWKAAWHDFYEDDWRGDDYVLLQMLPDRLEVISAEFDVAMAAKGFRPAILVRTAEGWRPE